jgi:hypothetical protein
MVVHNNNNNFNINYKLVVTPKMEIALSSETSEKFIVVHGATVQKAII